MRGETFSETKDQLSTATFDKVGRLYSLSNLNACVVLRDHSWACEISIAHSLRVTDARIETKLSQARQGESAKNGLSKEVFDADEDVIERLCANKKGSARTASTTRLPAGKFASSVSLGPTQK